MKTPLLIALSCTLLALPASGVEVVQTGRFTPDPFGFMPGSPSFLGSPIAAGAGLVVVGETELNELYVNDAQTGLRIRTIAVPFGPEGFDLLSVSLENTTAAVGAQGTASLYDVSTGTKIRDLLPTTPLPAGASFGTETAIGDGVALVSATDLVYAFDVATGNEIAVFEPTQPDSGFGSQLDIANGVAIISANRDSQAGPNAGAAYLFDTDTGNLIQKVTGSSAQSFLGAGVAIDQDLAFIAEPTSLSGLLRQVGVYEAQTGNRLGTIQTDTGPVDPSFGSFLSADSGQLLVGSPLEGDGFAYLFDTASRTQIGRFAPTDGEPFFEFGWGVALSDNYAGVLSTGGETAAYTFLIVPEPGTAVLSSLALICVWGHRRR